MQLSLIISAYNAQSYIESCKNAINKQEYTDFEIIAVNDGSIDDTSSLLDEWAKQDSRVRVLHLEHGGLIRARNEATGICNSEYVAFFDVDDDLGGDFIGNYIRIIEVDHPDAIICDYVKEEGQRKKVIRNALSPGKYCGERINEFYGKMMCNGIYYEFGVNPFMCTKAFKRELILPFMEARDPEITEGEDAAAVFPAFLSCKKIVISDSAEYHYLYRPKSMTHDRGDMYYSNAARLSFYLDRAFAKTEYYDIMRPQMEWYMRMLLYTENPNAFELRAHVFPFGKVDKGSRIALYGAGNVGELYERQIRTQKYGELCLWVDGSWESMRDRKPAILSPEKLVETEFDYVVIAVDNQDTIKAIKDRLLAMGVVEQKIVW